MMNIQNVIDLKIFKLLMEKQDGSIGEQEIIESSNTGRYVCVVLKDRGLVIFEKRNSTVSKCGHYFTDIRAIMPNPDTVSRLDWQIQQSEHHTEMLRQEREREVGKRERILTQSQELHEKYLGYDNTWKEQRILESKKKKLQASNAFEWWDDLNTNQRQRAGLMYLDMAIDTDRVDRKMIEKMYGLFLERSK